MQGLIPPPGIPVVGEMLAGKYRIENVLGVGGMGIVMAARHEALKQRVAIKFLLPHCMNYPDVAERFLREAQAAAGIRSEHIVRITDFGTLESGSPYMVMEHLVGCDLERFVSESGPLPLDQAVEYVLQAGEAVFEAHALGIVHRDLKPANLFLAQRTDGSPLVKVLDFGISKPSTVDRSHLTTTGSAIGSPAYMSPEQIRDAKNVDPRTDVWGLGVVLYELLTGHIPFEGENPHAVMAKVLTDPPTPLRSWRPDVPIGLEGVVFQCLEKLPARRFSDVAELALALEPFASPESQGSIERIARLARASSPQLPSSPVLRERSPNALTGGAWQTGAGGHARNFGAWIVASVAAAALGVGLLVAALVLRNRPPPPGGEVEALSPPSATAKDESAPSTTARPTIPPATALVVEAGAPATHTAEPELAGSAAADTDGDGGRSKNPGAGPWQPPKPRTPDFNDPRLLTR